MGPRTILVFFFPEENVLIFLLEIQPELTGCPACGTFTVRVMLSRNNRVNVKIKGNVILRNLKLVKERKFIQGDT
jgi:hypothetical protein